MNNQQNKLVFVGNVNAIFTNPGVGTATGVGTSTFTWGEASNGQPNRFGFIPKQFRVAPDEIFSLGTLDYFNGETVDTPSSVDLELGFDFDKPKKGQFRSATYGLSMYATSNTDDPIASADSIFLGSGQRVRLNVSGDKYVLDILGFGEVSGTQTFERRPEFFVQENQTDRAELRARFVPIADYKALNPKWDEKKRSLRVGYEALISSGDELTGDEVKVGLFYGKEGEVVGDELTGIKLGKPEIKGNRVFYDISTQKMPLNFTNDQLTTNQIVVKLDPKDEVLETDENNNQSQISDFFIRRIPQIMRNKGWIEPANFMERWFRGSGTSLDNTRDFETNPNIKNIPLSWVLNPANDSDGRVRKFYNEIIDPNVVFNKPAQGLLGKRIRERFGDAKLGQTFKLTPDKDKGKALHDQYIQTRNVPAGSSSSIFELPTLDPVQGALGRFSFHAVPIGTVKIQKDKQDLVAVVRVEKFGVYLIDSYEFIGWQPLGYWGSPDRVDFSIFEGGTFVENASFDDNFRKKTGVGQDFLVMSPVEVFSVNQPKIFNIDL